MTLTRLLIALAFMASGFACGEDSLLVPAITGGWTPATTPASPGERPLVVEPEPGHFIRFDARHKGASLETRVYHSTNPKDFGTESKNGDALHFVTSLPVDTVEVMKQDNQWSLIARRAGVEGLQQAKLTWVPLPPAVPNTRHTASEKLRVALYDDSGSAGKGVPSCEAELRAVPGMEVIKITAEGVRAGLSGYDVVIFSGGSGGKQANTIGLSGREQVHRFVEAGGGYVGICAGAYLACSGFSWGVHVLNAKTPSPLWERGHADLEIETTKAGRNVLQLPVKSTVIYHNGPIITPGKQTDMPEYEPLVYFRTEIAQTPKQAGLQINTPAMVRSTCGRGHVLVSSPHPEQTPGMEHWIEHAVRAVASGLN